MAVCKSLSPVFVRVLYTCRNTWTRIQLLSIELNRVHANTFLINRRQCYVIVRVDAVSIGCNSLDSIGLEFNHVDLALMGF